MIEQSLVTYLEAQSGITTLTSTRIYPIYPPQNPTYPLITYERIDSQLLETMGGQIDFEAVDFRITSWGSTYVSAVNVRKAVVTALLNYSGLMDTLTVKKVTINEQVDQYHEASEIYLSSISITLFYDK